MPKRKKDGTLLLEEVNGIEGQRYLRFAPALGGRDTVYVASEFGEVQDKGGYTAWDVFLDAGEVDEFYRFACFNGVWKVVDTDDSLMAASKGITNYTFQRMLLKQRATELKENGRFMALSNKTWLAFPVYNKPNQVLYFESVYGSPQDVIRENIGSFVHRSQKTRYRFIQHRGEWKAVLFADQTKLKLVSGKMKTLEGIEMSLPSQKSFLDEVFAM